jgi:hypothetical protein
VTNNDNPKKTRLVLNRILDGEKHQQTNKTTQVKIGLRMTKPVKQDWFQTGFKK